MSTTESSIGVSERPSPPRMAQLLAHNPFYLLSGVCLFAGCFLVSAALREDRDQLVPVLTLFGVVTVYEWLVLGLGLLLVAWRGLTRDGGYLLLLAILLLSDGTFVYNEVATMSAAVGGTINATAVVLGLLKVALIGYVIGLRFDVVQWCVLALNLTVLMMLPLLFRTLAQAEVLTTPVFHMIWWVAGVWLAIQALAPLHRLPAPVGLDTIDKLRNLVHRAVLVIPALSVLVHLGAGHFVYDVPFYTSHLTPMLLGLAVYLAVSADRSELVCRFVFFACLAALLVSLPAPNSLIMTNLWPGEWTLSPLRAALVGAAIAWSLTAWRQREGWLWLCAVAAIGLAVTGASPRDMGDRLKHWGIWVRDTPGSLLPTSLLHWGMLILGLAFFLLLLGGIVSLRRPLPSADKQLSGKDEVEGG